jgi:outer membrane protein assembly factor BamE (lipoprotein component of BamABCDE complex)
MGAQMKRALVILVLIVFLTPCLSVSSYAKSNADDKVTVGKVQREIRMGMAASQVIEVLGSPNIVTTDENRLEVWVYDKIATDVSYSNSGGGIWLLIASAGGNSGKSSTSQRTLTIVIKFDAEKKVRDFAYHSSSF